MSAYDELKARWINGGAASDLEFLLLMAGKAVSKPSLNNAAAELAELKRQAAMYKTLIAMSAAKVAWCLEFGLTSGKYHMTLLDGYKIFTSDDPAEAVKQAAEWWKEQG